MVAVSARQIVSSQSCQQSLNSPTATMAFVQAGSVGDPDTAGNAPESVRRTDHSLGVSNIDTGIPSSSFPHTTRVTNIVNDHAVSLNSQQVLSSYITRPSLNTKPAGSAPRRGSFPDILPHGHTPPPPINDSVPNLRGGMADNPITIPSTLDDVQTDSDPEFQFATPASRADAYPHTNIEEMLDTSTITVNSQGDMSVTLSDGTVPMVVKSNGPRRKKQYVLPDGSVVSGKGLGRGRPGIKRGPRKSQAEDQLGSPAVTIGTGGSLSRESSTPSKKRKSTSLDASDNRAQTVDSAMSGSRASSEEYNPTAHTRSGRQIQKPTILPTTVPINGSPANKLSRNNSTVNAPSNSPAQVKTHPKIKRRVYRGREQFALCEHCLRGYGPPGNVIVFCDACNKCWHQRCHDPQISKQTVSDSKAEWYCSDCDRILHGKKKDKKNVSNVVDQRLVTPRLVTPTPIVKLAPTYAGPLVGGRFIPPEQKLAYLKTLSKDDLVSRLLHASNLAPDLPIFQALVPPPPPPVVMPQAQFTSSYVTPVSKVPSFGDKDAADDAEVDEGYDGYFDEHAALYPKPGKGLQLPPESEDMHMLLEGKESKTFSHKVYNR